jgi:uncharacterized protein (DUF1919 family)
MDLLLRLQKKLSLKIARKLIPNEFTIISDDCWGGQLYRQLNIPYLTPTIGLWIKPEDYLKYIEEFNRIHKEKLIFIPTDKSYPVATLSGVEINFMHYKSKEEAQHKYYNRLQRLQSSRLLTKIDFGKPGYTIAHIHKWNELRIDNAIAFYPTTIEIPKEGVYCGVPIPEWELDGLKMFEISKKYFDLFKWIRTGKINNSFIYRIANMLLFDPTSLRQVVNKLFHRTR